MCTISLVLFIHYLYSGESNYGLCYGLLSDSIDNIVKDYSIITTVIPINMLSIARIFKDLIVILGIITFYNYCCNIYNWIRVMYLLGLRHFIGYIQNVCFEQIKEFPLIRNEINKEMVKFSADLDSGIKSKAREMTTMVNQTLPKKVLIVMY